MSDGFIASIRPTFRAVAVAVVPEAAALDDGGWADVESIVEQAVLKRPESLRRQLNLFVRVLNAASVIRYGRALPRLDAERRGRLLESVQDAPLLLLRRGMWGLRTLVFMGYYARAGAAAEIGYRAQPAGWSARATPYARAGEGGGGR